MEIPKHIALIPDGNRRWARGRGLPPWHGHWKAEKVIDNFLNWCLEYNIHQISIWIGSTENLAERPKREVAELYKLYMKLLEEWGSKKSVIDKYEVKVRFIGDLNKLPPKMVKLMGKIMQRTAKYQKKLLNILVNYGGKFELVEVFKKLANQVIKAGKIEIRERDIENNLLVKTPVDLVVRTGGYNRLSNFMLWQSSYAEIYTTKTLLPDFNKEEFVKALEWYSSIKRNFGA
ncbi:MAG: di-trans,poly-cis-decaprenylcistransferase [Candidatus Aenigmarchaeota archaeon]|nr:di-trans,poly-cis-decaprenylcistransferase [Candidatus Aenigmarchaeota archaeon]